MKPAINVVFLRDGHHGGSANQLTEVAANLATFVEAATRSLDIAIYDFRLADANVVSTVVGALTAAADRGIEVRIAFDAGKPAKATTKTFALMGADPAPVGTSDWVHQHFDGTNVQVRAVQAGSQLMHSKYIVRDAPTGKSGRPSTAVWTGSTNFTDDAWSRQENNIITIASTKLAIGYRTDFDQLWASGSIKSTGLGDTGTTKVRGRTVGWDFCPGDGAAINAALAAQVTGARRRLVIAAMVLTSHEVLAALADAVARGIPLSGIYDSGQMGPIVKEWKANPANATVLANWATVSAKLAHKKSTPFTPTGLHDFMHLKVLLADDVLTTGSYNFSANAEHNAENQVRLADPATVSGYADYLETVVEAYS